MKVLVGDPISNNKESTINKVGNSDSKVNRTKF